MSGCNPINSRDQTDLESMSDMDFNARAFSSFLNIPPSASAAEGGRNEDEDDDRWLQKPSFDIPFWDPRLEPTPLAASSSPLPLTANSVDSSPTIRMRNLIDFALNTAHKNGVAAPIADEEKQDDDMWAPKPVLPQVISNSKRDISNYLFRRELAPPMPKRQRTTTSHAESEERISRFNDHHEGLWQEQFHKLRRYQDEFGHCGIPIGFPQDLILARWVKRQRYQYKKYQEGKPCAINSQRIQLLECIGFVWDAHAVAWQEKFNELLLYKQQIGHCNVPSNDPINVQLSTWVKCQRRQYKLFVSNMPSNMTNKRIDALHSIGFKWNLRHTKNKNRAAA